MLKVVSTKQVRLGMFIQELKGPWINHPFWKNSFKLDDMSDLVKLQTSIIKEVIIDTSKGLDVAAEPQAPVLSPNADQVIEPIKKPKKISVATEQKQARKVIEAAKEAVASMFHDARLGKVMNAEVAIEVVDDVTASIERNAGALVSLIRLKNQDEYTYLHSVAVCALMVALAKELGLDETQTKQAGLAGLLHDIGKASIPLEILNKPGPLTDEEFTVVKLHPQQGHDLLVQSGIIDDVALDVCLHHHEKVNGAGYPKKFTADEISLFAKMGAVCDVYDAVTSDRPYKMGWEPGVALQRMAQWTEHFDQRVFKAFVKSIGIYPIGSTVRLKSGRLAVVIEQNATSLLNPVVKVFFSTKANARIQHEVVDLSKPHAQDAIVDHDNASAWGITDIKEIWTECETGA